MTNNNDNNSGKPKLKPLNYSEIKKLRQQREKEKLTRLNAQKRKEQIKFAVLSLILITVVIGAAIIFYLLKQQRVQHFEENIQKQISAANFLGNVEWASGQTGIWQTLSGFDSLTEEDKLRCLDENSWAELTISEVRQAIFWNSARIELLKVQLLPNNSRNIEILLENGTGTFEIGREPGSFTIQTSEATFRVTSSSQAYFKVQRLPQSTPGKYQTRIAVKQGIVEAFSNQSELQNQIITINANDRSQEAIFPEFGKVNGPNPIDTFSERWKY